MYLEFRYNFNFFRRTLMTYLKSYHSPDRMVLAGVGVDHDQLVEVAQV